MELTKTSEKVMMIAKTAHEVSRAFCEGIGDNSQMSWDKAPLEIKQSVIDGVNFLRKNPRSSAQDLHNNWVDFKMSLGWVYGKIKDSEQKTHPCLVQYRDLPKHQRTKDKLFETIVKSFQ